ncbi:MAG: hypothetical protein ABEJ68_06975 [Halobacteriaceae archaeon]
MRDATPARLAAVLCVLVGVALLLSSAWLVPHAGKDACRNRVERQTPDPAFPADEHLDYSALSPDARAVFDAARHSPDGTVTVYGDDCPEQFNYYGDVATHYAIDRNDTTYRLVTRGSGFAVLPWSLALSWALALTGLAVGVVGVRSARAGRTMAPALFAGLGALTLGIAAVSAFPAKLWMVAVLVAACCGAGAVSRRRPALVTGSLLVPAATGWFLLVDGGVGPHTAVSARLFVGVLVILPLLVRIGAEASAAVNRE